MGVSFVHIHPFVDGNGRTARLLVAGEVLKEAQLPHIPIIDKSWRKEYMQHVSDATIRTDCTGLCGTFSRAALLGIETAIGASH